MERLDYDRDVREPADNKRRIKFREGWRHGAAGEFYGPNVLDELKWENLGHRMGRILKDAPEPFIDAMYAMCALLQDSQKAQHKK
ncbi:MAG: hypothetical protein ACLQOO_28710 [Terriglobia bacterium]